MTLLGELLGVLAVASPSSSAAGEQDKATRPARDFLPGDHRLFDAARVEQTDHVAEQMQQRVAVDLRRGIGLSIATHIWRNRVKTGRRQRRELVPPRIPALGEAVAQQDCRTAPLLCNVHADAVGLDDAMLCLGPS
jgi:hypothetical protein